MGTVRTLQSKHGTNLRVIFRIPSVQRNSLQVESAIQVHSSHDILKGWNNALYGGDMLLLKSQRSGSSGDNGLGGGTGNCLGGGLGGGLGGRRGRRRSRKG